MNAVELKKELIKKLNTLTEPKLSEAYGVLMNFLNGQKDVSEEWDSYTQAQKNAVEEGLLALEDGDLYSHETVMREVKSKLDKND